MQTTRVKIYPSAVVPRIDSLHQSGGVPFRAYEVLVDRIKAAIAYEPEEQSCVIVQTEHGPEAWYDHVLSPMEVLQRDNDQLANKLERLANMLPREGEAMSAEAVAALRAVIG